jgi:hypothetical protein
MKMVEIAGTMTPAICFEERLIVAASFRRGEMNGAKG